MTKLKSEKVIPETVGTNLPDNQILTFTLVHSWSRDWVLKPLISFYYFIKSATVIHKQPTYVTGIHNYDEQQLKNVEQRDNACQWVCTHSPLFLLSGFHFLDSALIDYGTAQSFNQSQCFGGTCCPNLIDRSEIADKRYSKIWVTTYDISWCHNSQNNTLYISTNMITSEFKHSVSKILGQISGVSSHTKTR